ncbi:MAG: flagellar biosynthetic protein FliO [Spirochaetes bacterium]|nr:flagellar biosynthetic protein FliO [Spirochaetota bacterium]
MVLGKSYPYGIRIIVLFFFFYWVLCPMEGWAEVKSKSRISKREQIAHPVQMVQNQTAGKQKDVINIDQRNEEQGTGEKNVGTSTGNPAGGENDARMKSNPDNGFQRYADYRAEETETQSYGWLIFKTLMIIALLVGGFYYFFRFVTKKTGIQILGKDMVHVLSIVPLGQNKYLEVVDLAGKVLVLGVTDSNISFITEITEKEQIDRIRVMSAKTAEREVPRFREFISQQIVGFLDKHVEKKKQIHETDEDRLEYLIRQRERLKKIRGDINEA